MRRPEGGLAGEERLDFQGAEVEDAFVELDDAVDDERRLFDDAEAAALEELGRDDNVGDAGFVFQAEEEDAVSGAGTLAADDGSAGADAQAIRGLFEIGGSPEVGEMGTKQAHRVAASGEAGGAEIGADTLGEGHGGQR